MKTTLNIDLPEYFDKYEQKIQQSIIDYLSQLSEIQQKAYLIAKDHLGSSFNILKSNGYIQWKKTNENK